MFPNLPPELLQMLAQQGQGPSQGQAPQGQVGVRPPVGPGPVMPAQGGPAPGFPPGPSPGPPNQAMEPGSMMETVQSHPAQGYAQQMLDPLMSVVNFVGGQGMNNMVGQSAREERGKADSIRRDMLDQAPPTKHPGTLRPGGALLMAALSGIMHTIERGSEKGFQQGFEQATRQRIDTDYQAQLDKLNEKRKKQEFEAGLHDRNAGDLQGLQQGMQRAGERYGDQQQRLREIALQNQGRVDLQQTRNSGTTEKELLQGYRNANGPAMREVLGRILQDQFPQYRGMPEERIVAAANALYPKEANELAGAGLKTEQANDLVATRAARVSKLLAEGKGAEARVEYSKAQAEASKARAALDNIKAAWLPKTEQAKIDKMASDATAAITRANNSSSSVIGKKGVTPTSYFNALNDVQDSLAKIGGFKTKVEAETTQAKARKAELEGGKAKGVNPAGANVELAEIEALLRANAVQMAYLNDMETRMNGRLSQIAETATSNPGVGDIGGGVDIPSLNMSASDVAGKGKGITGTRTGATLRLKGG